MKLTAGQLEQYDRDGFLLLPELLSARDRRLSAEVERLKSVSSECVFHERIRTQKIMFKMDDRLSNLSESFRALSLAAH